MSFGFETPAWLSAIALVLPLAWLYLRRLRRPPVVVSSLVVWRAVAKQVVPRRRLRLPLLFLVQALLIAAGAIAVAGPFLARALPPGPPRDAVIVLDVSASMQAKLDNGTRFDAARAAAVARARALGDEGRRITVIAAALQPRLLGSGLDGRAAANLLEAQSPVDTAGNLTAAAELAATHAGPHGSVELFTDTPIDDLVMSRDARAATTVHRFGSGGENLAILSVRVETNPFADRLLSRVLINVRSFADQPRTLVVEIAPLDPAAGKPVQSKLTVGPRATELVTFDEPPWSGPFAARLIGGDDLPLDDVAYGFVPPRHPLDILLVSEDASLTHAFESLVHKLGNAALRSVAPAAYHPDSLAEITIFDRVAPPIPPTGNVAYLAPHQGNPDVSIVGPASDARFAEVREHELLRGVQNPETLLSGHLVGLAPSGPLKPVLLGRAEGREAALALAGEDGGRRVVATAFALRPDSLSDPDALPSLVFTLNLLRWLSPQAEEAPLERLSGERLRAGSAGAPAIARLIGPDGEHQLSPTEERTIERAGVYRALAPGHERMLLVNFLDPAESDIHRSAEAPEAAAAAAPAAQPSDSAPALARLPRAREALLLAIALMALEWLVVGGSARRRSRPRPDDDPTGDLAARPAAGEAS